MTYNYDWWFGGIYLEHMNEAKRRCAIARKPDAKPDSKALRDFTEKLEVRTVVYLRDGFSYEIKELVARPNTTTMTFECMPADEAYRVGCFLVTVPYDDIVRVELYAVHPEEKPEDMPSIKGFAGAQPPPGRMDERPRPRET